MTMTMGTITVRRYAIGVITPITRMPAHPTVITVLPGSLAACSSAPDRGMGGATGTAGAATATAAAMAIAVDTPTVDAAGLKDAAAMVDAPPMAATESAAAMVAQLAALTVAAA